MPSSISLDDFTPLTLANRESYLRVQSKNPPVHSDEVFSTLASWSHYGNYRFFETGDNIAILGEINGRTLLRPPIGPPNPELFGKLISLAKDIGSDRAIVLITERDTEWICRYFAGLNFTPDRDYYDYVYKSSDLANLPGKCYLQARKRINRFNRNHKYSVEEISDSNMDESKEFLERWCLWKDCSSHPMLEAEREAVRFSINHFEELGLRGIIVRINDKIEALSIFERLNSNTAIVHFEKGIADYDGIYQIINMETAKLLEKDFEFINRESDLGLPGLRLAKQGYCPDHMLKVCHLRKEDLDIVT